MAQVFVKLGDLKSLKLNPSASPLMARRFFSPIPPLSSQLALCMISRSVLAAKVISVISIVVLFQALICLSGRCQTCDFTNILNKLPPIGKMAGYKITALETNIMFNQRDKVLRVLHSASKTNLSKEQIAALEAVASKMGNIDTNICVYVYRFGEGVITISSETFNTLGKMTQKNTTLITSGEIREYDTPIQDVKSISENLIGTAKIQNQERNVLIGLPAFLSKSTLHDLIEHSLIQSNETGQALSGQNCNIITISGISNAPIKTYKLFLQSDTLTPVEFNSYLANGTILSRTDLEFEYPGSVPYVCKRADVQIFVNGELSRQSVWVAEHIEVDTSPLTDDIESFIPPKTQVWDQRFSKPLNYHMSAHPPTLAQINLMLTDSNGVASYESGIFIQAGTNKISGERRNWIRGIFIVLIVSPLLIFIPKLLKKR